MTVRYRREMLFEGYACQSPRGATVTVFCQLLGRRQLVIKKICLH